ncbi:hypothetical protein ACFL2Q_09025 [Thermodesulfobacteriota bacterium]
MTIITGPQGLEGNKPIKESHWLLDFAESTYSQTGEDGIIRRILDLLPCKDYWCVEFGADDGIRGSNTRRLIEQENYSAVLIEGDEANFRKLVTNYSGNARVKCLNKYVGFGYVGGLDDLLSPFGLPPDFDFLSIDIDGNDYHVWRAVREYHPKLVCIEFNPTIPTEVEFVQPADPAINQGCSLSVLCRLAREKDYDLVCCLPYNAFFVDSRYFHLFDIEDNSPQVLRRDLSWITWFFVGFDGSIHLAGRKTLPWHCLEINPSHLQVLPRSLRAFPRTYSRVQRHAMQVFRRYLKWRDST